jgi:hypothetical protein
MVYKDSGLENENIRNSAVSCMEREKRFEILGLKKHQGNGILLQIQNKEHHEFWELDNVEIRKDLKEFLRICKMQVGNLEKYIDSKL